VVNIPGAAIADVDLVAGRSSAGIILRRAARVDGGQGPRAPTMPRIIGTDH
jgi:hypothetical protein